LGISGRRHLPLFLTRSPADHYTVWNHRQAARTGRRHGFRLAGLKSVGHHAERFPGLLGRPAFRPLSAIISRICSLGDGMELYFVKINT